MSHLPGWGSIDSTARLHNFFELFGIFLFLVVVVCEGLSYAYGHRHDKLARQQESAAEQHHEAEVAAAREAARKASDELAEFKLSRSLTVEQREKLSEWLADKPKGLIKIKASIAARDANAYANEIAGFLRDRGWNVVIENAIIGGPDTAGLWFSMKDGDRAAPGIAEIHNGFEHAGIPVRHAVLLDAGIPTFEEIWLEIGLKP
jgi:hypothetical protein